MKGPDRKMKKYLLMLIVILAAAVQSFAAESGTADLHKSFSNYCGTEMAKVFETYKGEQYSIVHKEKSNKPEHWTKTSESVDSAYSIEIRKSEVPDGPDTGILTVKHSTKFYADNFESEEKAKSETNVTNTAHRIFKFFISYENDQWILKKVTIYTHWHQKKWHTVPPTGIFEILQSNNEVKLQTAQ